MVIQYSGAKRSLFGRDSFAVCNFPVRKPFHQGAVLPSRDFRCIGIPSDDRRNLDYLRVSMSASEVEKQ